MELCSAASDVDPSTILGSGPTEPVAVGQTTVWMATTEHAMAQPATAPMTKRIAEDPAQEGADVNAPIRDEGAAGTPPPSSVAEEENRAPSPTQVEGPPV